MWTNDMTEEKAENSNNFISTKKFLQKRIKGIKKGELNWKLKEENDK